MDVFDAMHVFVSKLPLKGRSRSTHEYVSMNLSYVQSTSRFTPSQRIFVQKQERKTTTTRAQRIHAFVRHLLLRWTIVATLLLACFETWLLQVGFGIEALELELEKRIPKSKAQRQKKRNVERRWPSARFRCFGRDSSRSSRTWTMQEELRWWI